MNLVDMRCDDVCRDKSDKMELRCFVDDAMSMDGSVCRWWYVDPSAYIKVCSFTFTYIYYKIIIYTYAYSDVNI